MVVLAAVGAALVGRSLGTVPARRARVLREAMDALQILRIQMLERLLPLHAALAQARFEPFRMVGERMAAGGDAPEPGGCFYQRFPGAAGAGLPCSRKIWPRLRRCLRDWA